MTMEEARSNYDNMPVAVQNILRQQAKAELSAQKAQAARDRAQAKWEAATDKLAAHGIKTSGTFCDMLC